MYLGKKYTAIGYFWIYPHSKRTGVTLSGPLRKMVYEKVSSGNKFVMVGKSFKQIKPVNGKWHIYI